MKVQWNLLFGLLFAIVIALFAIFNVEAVQVNYIFGQAQWPLVLVILCSALLGAVVSGCIAMFRTVQANHQMKELRKEIDTKDLTIAAQQNEISELQKRKVVVSKHAEINENKVQ